MPSPEPSLPPSTSSLAASPASPSAWLDGDEEPPTVDGSGPSSHGSLAFYDPASRCWRTSQGSLLDLEWPRFSGTWPRSGSMRSGTVSPLPPLVRLTSAGGSLSWPTPHHGMGSHGRRGSISSALAARLPTPTAADGERGSLTYQGNHNPTLLGAVRMWPTPKTPTGGGQMARTTPGGGIRKMEDAVSQEIGRNTGSLNPTWVEWLMGFPLGWTDLGASEMPLSPRSQSGSGA